MAFHTTSPGTGCPSYGGGQVANPANVIVRSDVPSAAATASALGTLYVDTTTDAIYALVDKTAGVATWAILGGAAGAVATLTGGSGGAIAPSAGNITLAGTANQITTTGAGSTITWSLPAAITAPGSLTTTTTNNATTTMTAGTGITSTTGNITATAGNLVAVAAASGLVLPVTTGSGAQGGTVNCNGRVGSVTFTGVSIAAGATLTFTIGNTSVTGSGTVVLVSMRGATTGTSPVIQSVTNSANTTTIVVTNGTTVITDVANKIFDFIVLN